MTRRIFVVVPCSKTNGKQKGKIMKLVKKLTVLGASFIFSFASVAMIIPSSVRAAVDTCTWTGGGAGAVFSDAGNWTGCDNGIVPENGDSLTFDITSLAADQTVTNDMTGLVVDSVSFTGTNSNYKHFVITGNSITINSAINDSGDNVLDVDITLGGDVTMTESSDSLGTSIGIRNGAARTLNTNGHTLSVAGPGASCGVGIYAALSGAGGFSSSLSSFVLFGSAATSFTGSISASAGDLLVSNSSAFGSTNGVTISGTGSLYLGQITTDKSYSFPITLGGTGTLGASQNTYNRCAGGDMDTANTKLTLTGTVTLNTDFKYYGNDVDTEVTGSFVNNGHSFSVTSGSRGKITTPEGTVTAPVQTITVDSGDEQPTTSIITADNQIYVINGVRGDISVNPGSTLKGSGTVGVLTVADGGTVAPGNSPGCLTAGNTTFVANSNFDVELGGTTVCSGYDQLVVNGTVDLGSATLNTSLYNSYSPAANTAYIIVNNDSTDAVTGTFAGLAEGATFSVGGNTFTITYKGGDGNDVVLTVVGTAPAPGTPSTGFNHLFSANPLLSIVAGTAAAAAIMAIHRRNQMQKGE